MRPGEELKDGPPIHGNTRLEIIWTAIPAILLVGLCTYAYVTLIDIEKAQANAMNVRVVGEQFTWTFHYRGEDGKEISSNQLYLPENTPVYFTVQSKDVIHDFWVPAFRMKIDAVPGIDTHLRVTTKGAPGNYPVVCAELCGLGHSTMRQTAHVLSRSDFDAQLDEAGGRAQAGRRRRRQGGDRRQDALHGGRAAGVRVLPHAGRRRRDRHDRPGPRQGGPEPQRRRDQGVDQGSERQDHRGLLARTSCRVYGETLSDKQVDALVKYLKEVAGG